MNVPPGYVGLHCDDPSLSIVVLLGPEPVKVTGGLGGWEVTARPRQVGMTTWQGNEPLQVSLSLMFDGWSMRASVEEPLRQLFTVARGDDESPPGIVDVEGIVLPADRWVIENVDYGEPILDPATMERYRQPMTVTLREYVPPTYLQQRKTALQGVKGKTKVITVRKGDTPANIARRQKCKWTDVRALNPTVIKKANQTLKTGTKLRAPVAVARVRKPPRPLRGHSRS
jgi:hypothetical protein